MKDAFLLGCYLVFWSFIFGSLMLGFLVLFHYLQIKGLD